MKETAFAVLAETIGAMAGVVSSVGPEEYVEPGLAPMSGSVGAHVRHCLDHLSAFERGMAAVCIENDDRVRETSIERDRVAGVMALAAAGRRVRSCDPARLDDPVLVAARLRRNAASRMFVSTIGRELTFVISHTIHPSATVTVLLSAGGRHVPAPFGFAPSTPVGFEDATCVRSA
jgi:uncharacterized damage-inducible protein DinB